MHKSNEKLIVVQRSAFKFDEFISQLRHIVPHMCQVKTVGWPS
jgi:hypothetical protein